MLEHGERCINFPGNMNTEFFLRKQANDTTHLPICVAKKETGTWIVKMGGRWDMKN